MNYPNKCIGPWVFVCPRTYFKYLLLTKQNDISNMTAIESNTNTPTFIMLYI